MKILEVNSPSVLTTMNMEQCPEHASELENFKGTIQPQERRKMPPCTIAHGDSVAKTIFLTLLALVIAGGIATAGYFLFKASPISFNLKAYLCWTFGTMFFVTGALITYYVLIHRAMQSAGVDPWIKVPNQR